MRHSHIMRMLVLSSGPAKAPAQVIKRTARRITRDTPSLLELNDSSVEGRMMLDQATSLARSLLHVPEDFVVLLLPGGACQQFAIAAWNLANLRYSVTFLVTDYWTERARLEFQNFLTTSRINVDWRAMQGQTPINTPGNAVFLTSNNTASGSCWPVFPQLGGDCRIVDMSSDLFARRPDYDQADLVIGAAQKNFGVAGISLLIVRKALLARVAGRTGVFSYTSWIEAKGMYNTFPIVPLAITLESLEYIREIGGVDAVARMCKICSSSVYDFIDGSRVFEAPVPPAIRSPHNVVFRARSPEIQTALLERASARGVVGIKGHPSTRGLRASFYFGAEPSDATRLVDFLGEFE